MLPNVKLMGVAATVLIEAVPIPESTTLSGLLLAESIKLNVAVRVPVDNGLKRIVTVQLAWAPRRDAQVLLEIKKSAEWVPVIATLLMAIEAEPPLVNLTDLDAPTVPSETAAQLTLDGLAVAAARHFDPEIEPRIRSVIGINDLRIKVFAVEAAGTRNNCAIRQFMGGSFFTKNERQHLRPNCDVAP